MNPGIATRIASQVTIVIHSRACVLRRIITNTGATSAVLTVYNNSAGSGDVVATIDGSNTSQGVCREYNVHCPQGLTVVLSGGNADMTIVSDGPSV